MLKVSVQIILLLLDSFSFKCWRFTSLYYFCNRHLNILWMSWRWDCWSMSNPHTLCLSTFVATVILSGSGRSLQKYRRQSRGKVCTSSSSCIRRIPIFPPSSFLPRNVNYQCFLFHLKANTYWTYPPWILTDWRRVIIVQLPSSWS